MSDIDKRAADLLFTKTGWEKAEKALAKLEKNKKPTDKFRVFGEALELLKQLVDDDDEIKIEYDYTNGTIYWYSYYISIYDIEKLRQLLDRTDIFGAVVMADDRIQMDFSIKGLFEIDKP